MKSIDADIKKGNFSPVYLLYGEESYLKKQYKQKLKNALCESDDLMNVAYYEGKKLNTKEIINLAQTLPFFAERSIIVIENSEFFKKACEDLANYMKNIAETTYFIFVEEEIDKRSKMYKEVKKIGNIVEFKRQSDSILEKWILTRLKGENKKITESVLRLFMEKSGNDMENIDKELEKLFCYTLGREAITTEDIEAICVEQTTGKIFQMVDNIAEKKQKQALQLYYDLITLRESPISILLLIARHFQILLQVKELSRQSNDTKFISAKAGIREFTVKKYLAQAQRFTIEALKNAITDCVQAQEDIQTGNMNNKMAVELLIIKYASGAVV